MTNSEHDSLSAFRKFIEETLNLAGLGDEPDLPLLPDSTAFESDFESYYPTLREDIRKAWDELHGEASGLAAWDSQLTPLELATRGVLQEIILETVLKRFPAQPGEDDMRRLVSYTMTMSWLILAALLSKHRSDDDDDAFWIDTDDLGF